MYSYDVRGDQSNHKAYPTALDPGRLGSRLARTDNVHEVEDAHEHEEKKGKAAEQNLDRDSNLFGVIGIT